MEVRERRNGGMKVKKKGRKDNRDWGKEKKREKRNGGMTVRKKEREEKKEAGIEVRKRGRVKIKKNKKKIGKIENNENSFES